MRRAALSADVCHTCWKTSDSWKMTTFIARYSLHPPTHRQPTNQIVSRNPRPRAKQQETKKTPARAPERDKEQRYEGREGPQERRDERLLDARLDEGEGGEERDGDQQRGEDAARRPAAVVALRDRVHEQDQRDCRAWAQTSDRRVERRWRRGERTGDGAEAEPIHAAQRRVAAGRCGRGRGEEESGEGEREDEHRHDPEDPAPGEQLRDHASAARRPRSRVSERTQGGRVERT